MGPWIVGTPCAHCLRTAAEITSPWPATSISCSSSEAEIKMDKHKGERTVAYFLNKRFFVPICLFCRSFHIYNADTGHWDRGPDLNEYRWYFGLCRIGQILYAVGGCGQLDSMEAIDIEQLGPTGNLGARTDQFQMGSGWVRKCPMGERRHLPGICCDEEHIYVLGNSIKLCYNLSEIHSPETIFLKHRFF